MTFRFAFCSVLGKTWVPVRYVLNGSGPCPSLDARVASLAAVVHTLTHTHTDDVTNRRSRRFYVHI